MPLMQKQIIPYFPQEINPFFKNFHRDFSIAAPLPCPRSSGCQVALLNKFRTVRKSRETAQFVGFCNCCYVNFPFLSAMVHSPCGLWKRAVEKHVDNVENSGLSTVIPAPAL